MTLAVATSRAANHERVLDDYGEFVAGLEIGPEARRVRRRAAERLLAAHPDLETWMTRPAAARVVDLRRSGAWPFVTWCFVEGRLRPDLDLLFAKTPGDLFRVWQQRHRSDVDRLIALAEPLGWSANWTRDVTAALALVCLWAATTVDGLNDEVLTAFADAVDAAPSATVATRGHNHARLLSLHQACYQLRVCQHPPRKRMRRPATLAERVEAIAQPEIRRVAAVAFDHLPDWFFSTDVGVIRRRDCWRIGGNWRYVALVRQPAQGIPAFLADSDQEITSRGKIESDPFLTANDLDTLHRLGSARHTELVEPQFAFFIGMQTKHGCVGRGDQVGVPGDLDTGHPEFFLHKAFDLYRLCLPQHRSNEQDHFHLAAGSSNHTLEPSIILAAPLPNDAQRCVSWIKNLIVRNIPPNGVWGGDQIIKNGNRVVFLFLLLI
jgi:hypothetical protein